MRAWVRKILRRQVPAESIPEVRQEIATTLEAAQRSARAVARLGLRLDQVESKLEGGFADLRAQLSTFRSNGVPASRPPFELLFDAADLLDEAARLSASPGHAAGLAGIRERLERFLFEAGLQRVAQVDGPVDPLRFRVVGREDGGARPRVIRAAILDGERLVREGEIVLEREREEATT